MNNEMNSNKKKIIAKKYVMVNEKLQLSQSRALLNTPSKRTTNEKAQTTLVVFLFIFVQQNCMQYPSTFVYFVIYLSLGMIRSMSNG